MTTASANLHRLAIVVGELPRSGMITAAKAVKQIAQQEAQPYSPFHVGRRSVKLRAVDDIRTEGDQVTCRVQAIPVGLWVILNSGAGPHVIPKARKRKARKVRYVKGDRYEHPIGRPVEHPGASGRGVWRTVVKRAQRLVPEIFADAVHDAVTRHG